MTLGAEECKADAKKVSLIHVSRIFLTVLLIPNLLLLFFPGAYVREPTWPNLEGELFHIFAFIVLIPLGYYIGKKINFLIQEIGREINTIGAKSQQTDVTILVVDIKDELEKIREQIQNIL